MQSGHNDRNKPHRISDGRPNLPIPKGIPSKATQASGNTAKSRASQNPVSGSHPIHNTSNPYTGSSRRSSTVQPRASDSIGSQSAQSRRFDSQAPISSSRQTGRVGSGQLDVSRSRIGSGQSTGRNFTSQGQQRSNDKPPTQSRQSQIRVSQLRPNRSSGSGSRTKQKSYVLHDFLLGFGIGLAIFGTAAIFVVNAILNLF